jgi:uncharacterized iron-regulated membrane protein
MEPTFRASLNWLHTWAGLVFGVLLFAIFWTGTLSVFDREIDVWMAPAARLQSVANPLPVDAFRSSYDSAVEEKATLWSVSLPSERQPFVAVSWRGPAGIRELRLDPASGAPLPDAGTLGGTGFLYPFHYSLHIEAWRLGQWLVGAASMAMLALCVSGVLVHRRVFADFFVFRIAARPRRWLLDVHTVAGVTALPFLVAITLSGLTIAWPVYFPASLSAGYDGSRRAFNRDAFRLFDRPRIGTPGELASLEEMARAARTLWAGRSVRSISVWYPGDTGAYVQIVRRDEGRVAGTSDRAYFDAVTGALLHRNGALSPMVGIDRFLAGLHEIQFRHWTLRWLYFVLGLVGCALIATGHLFWLASRRRKHAQLGLPGVRIVDGLTVGSVSGIIAATLSFFVANRLLPPGATFVGYDRAALEIWTFCLVWLVSFIHAWMRPTRAWTEQCAAIAVLAIAAVALNGLTTGDHLARSLAHRHLWAVAGMDLLLIVAAAVALAAAHRLRGACRLTPS